MSNTFNAPAHLDEHHASRNSYADVIGHKNFQALTGQLGGVGGILEDLNVQGRHLISEANGRRSLGIDVNTIYQRRMRYGVNAIPEPPRSSIWHFVVESIKDDKVVQILIGAAFLSMVLGMTTPDYRTGKVDFATGWIEGAAIFISIFIVTGLNAVNDYKKQEQFSQLSQSEESSRQPIVVWRYDQGQLRTFEIANRDVVVGDVVQVSAGMQLTFDGVLLDSFGPIFVDESSATGENDEIFKVPIAQGVNANVSSNTTDPFLISGSCVLDGSAEGVAVVCAVGEHSFAGEIAMTIQSSEKSDTPLQEKLAELADTIGKFGLFAAIVTFVALLVKELYMWLFHGSPFYIVKFFENLTTAIAIVVVAVPEGLPLSVTVSLAYSMRRMLKDGNLVRHLAACETMGGATVLCVDKTGTLTLPNMRLRELCTGGQCYTLAQPNHDSLRFGAATVTVPIPPDAVQLLLDCVSANAVDPETGRAKNKTAEALLQLSHTIVTPEASFAHTTERMLGFLRDSARSVRFPFSSQSKQSVTLIRLNVSDSKEKVIVRQFISGAAEVVLAKSIAHLCSNGTIETLTPALRAQYEQTMNNYNIQGLRTICCAYVDIDPGSYRYKSQFNSSSDDVINSGLTPLTEGFCVLGIIGVEESIRPEVPDAVSSCMGAGIRVIMITGDAPLTAINIAQRCNLIYQDSKTYADAIISFDNAPTFDAPPPSSPSDLLSQGYVLEGATFRTLSDQELLSRYIPRLRILARATPLDKKRVVTLLKQYDSQAVVAMTGDGTNDAPALKLSDVGFAMNAGSDVAKQSSDIVLLSNSFLGMVKATVWGRNVKDNIRKFLQFQLTVNMAACIVAFFGALMSSQNISPLKPVQLLWLNLIMDTLAALALATELPCERILLSRPPERKDTPIIVSSMWFQVGVQSTFQLLLQLFLLSSGYKLFPKRSASAATTLAQERQPFGEVDGLTVQSNKIEYFGDEHICIVFNVFVWLQVFNFFNARLLNANEYFFDNWKDSKVLLMIVSVIAILQVFIVQFGGKFMSTVPLSFSQWFLCIAMGSLSLLVGAVSRHYYWRNISTGNGFRFSKLAPLIHLATKFLPKSKD